MPLDVTDTIISAIDWTVVLMHINRKVRTYKCENAGANPILYVPDLLCDRLLDGWASVYMCSSISDDLKTRLVKWIARFLHVDVSGAKPCNFSISQDAVQMLRAEMEIRNSLIVDGVWIRFSRLYW